MRYGTPAEALADAAARRSRVLRVPVAGLVTGVGGVALTLLAQQLGAPTMVETLGAVIALAGLIIGAAGFAIYLAWIILEVMRSRRTARADAQGPGS